MIFIIIPKAQGNYKAIVIMVKKYVIMVVFFHQLTLL
jgi:hypothetical protein